MTRAHRIPWLFALVLLLPLIAVPHADALPSRDGANAPPMITLATPVEGAGVRGSVNVAGTAFDAESSVTSVVVRIDGNVVATATLSPPNAAGITAWATTLDLALVPRGLHVLDAVAHDGSVASAPARATIMVGKDATPPRVTILAPRAGEGTDSRASVLASGIAHVEGDVIKNVLVRIDGGGWRVARLSNDDPIGAVWSLGYGPLEILPGPHSLDVVAFSANGGLDAASAPARVPFAVGNGSRAPELKLVKPVEGEGVSVTGDGGACEVVPKCFVIEGFAQDIDSAVTRVHLRIDSGPLVDVGASAAGAIRAVAGGLVQWRYEWPAASGFNGAHVVEAFATSGVNDSSAVSRATFALASARHVELRAPYSNLRSLDRIAAYAVSEPDGTTGQSVTWSINGVPVAEGNPLEHTFTFPGTYTLHARYEDDSGHVGEASRDLVVANRPPTAGFLVDHRGARGVADAVVLNASRSFDLDGGVTAYAWDFGDASSMDWSDSAIVVHHYAKRGTYNVRLRVMDDKGAVSAAATDTVTVVNSPPRAMFGYRNPGTLLDPVTFLDESFDPDADIVSRTWDFGDGQTSTELNPRHQYASRATYTVTLTVMDSQGLHAVATAPVPVVNLPPVASFTFADHVLRTREPVSFIDKSTKRDGKIVAWAWDFGDGNRSTDRNPTHLYTQRGTFIVGLVVTDDFGDQASTSRAVTIANSVPVADFDWGPAVASTNEDIVFRNLARDLDGVIVSHGWSFGDGSTSNATHPTHRFKRSGTYLVALTVMDDAGARVLAQRNITIANRLPVVRAAEALGIVNEPVLLEGDAVDPDGKIVDYAWDFDGNGFVDLAGVDLKKVWYKFREPGVYHPVLHVRDDSGGVATVRLNVSILPVRQVGPPPEVQVAHPIDGAVVSGRVTVTGSASAGASLVEVQFRRNDYVVSLDGDEWAPATSTRAWSYTFDSRHLGNEGYWIAVRARDGERIGPEQVVRVTVKNTESFAEREIGVVVDQPQPTEVVSGRVTIRGSATHPEGITLLRWRVDEGPWRDADGLPGFRATWDSREVPNGPHTLVFRAYRGLATWKDVSVPLTVANEPPTLVIDTPPLAWSVRGGIVFEGHVEGAPTREINARIDNGPWVNITATKNWVHAVNTTLLTDGAHVVSFRAIGVDGIASTPVSRHFTVSNDAPAAGAVGATIDRTRDTPGASVLIFLGVVAALAQLWKQRPSR